MTILRADLRTLLAAASFHDPSSVHREAGSRRPQLVPKAGRYAAFRFPDIWLAFLMAASIPLFSRRARTSAFCLGLRVRM
ncbi:MAG: hypothetical protein DMF49_03760 [Acidobacteria bacterium]|nr:MAG: hypothetical protein DMF49_03760 [Acidobacteriota bacterium]